MLENVKGVLGVYQVKGKSLVKLWGDDLRIDKEKLVSYLLENMEIGYSQAPKLKMGSFLGYAMILDDIGIVFLNNYLIITDPKKVNWDHVIPYMMKEVTRA